MTDFLLLTPNYTEIIVSEELTITAGLARVTDTSGWKVTEKRGAITGVGASVSGAGAWVKLKGKMSFTMKQMESSSTYNEMKTSYNIGGGVSGFWSWLGFGANAQTYKEEISKAFNEMSKSQEVEGTVDVDMYVSGQYPNVQVDASAYIFVLQMTDSQGSTTTTFSTGAASKDVGSQDSNGNLLPTNDNQSTISI